MRCKRGYDDYVWVDYLLKRYSRLKQYELLYHLSYCESCTNCVTEWKTILHRTLSTSVINTELNKQKQNSHWYSAAIYAYRKALLRFALYKNKLTSVRPLRMTISKVALISTAIMVVLVPTLYFNTLTKQVTPLSTLLQPDVHDKLPNTTTIEQTTKLVSTEHPTSVQLPKWCYMPLHTIIEGQSLSMSSHDYEQFIKQLYIYCQTYKD